MLNGYAINSVVLGNGSPSKNSYMRAVCRAVVTTSVTMYKHAMLSFNQRATARAVPTFNSIQAMRAAMRASASAVCATTIFKAKYLVASMRAFASATAVFGKVQNLATSMRATAAGEANFYAFRAGAAAMAARANITAHFQTYTGGAPAERTATVPADDRTARVS